MHAVRFLRHFLKHHRGNVLMLTGLSILILFAVGGAGYDFGRQQLVRMKMQNASDAAAIAAASLPATASEDERRTIALRYYNLNYPVTYLGVPRPTPNIAIGAQIEVQADVDMNANFISNVGVERLSAQGRTVVNRSADESAIYDVLLVMDNSGSMAIPASAPAFAEVPPAQQANRLNFMQDIVCRNEAIRRYNVHCDYYLTFYRGDGTTVTYSNASQCKTQGPQDYCDRIIAGPRPSAPEAEGFGLQGQTRLNALRHVALGFVERLIDLGQPGSRIGLVSWSNDATFARPLSSDSATIRQNINDMAAFEATNPVAAMQSARALGADFEPSHVKAVILLTDGMPTLSDTSYSYIAAAPYRRDVNNCDGSSFCGAAVNLTLPICDEFKNNGVQVYTIAFGEDVTTGSQAANAQDFLRRCASVDSSGQPRLFIAPSGAELDAAFNQILTALGKIRIAE